MKHLNKILANVLGVNEDDIIDETSPDNIETWDSFNGLMLVSELENAFNVVFTMDEVVSIKCVKDIKDALKKHGVNI